MGQLEEIGKGKDKGEAGGVPKSCELSGAAVAVAAAGRRVADATQARRAGIAHGRRQEARENFWPTLSQAARRAAPARPSGHGFIVFYAFVLATDHPPAASPLRRRTQRKVTLTGTCITNNNISGVSRNPWPEAARGALGGEEAVGQL